MDLDASDIHTDHFLKGARHLMLYIAAHFTDVDLRLKNEIQVRSHNIFPDFDPHAVADPRLNSRFTPPGMCAMRLTPGTLNAESRAMVTSTSGETVVFPCE